MATEQEREIRYLQEQLDYANNFEDKFGELTEQVENIEENLRELFKTVSNIAHELRNIVDLHKAQVDALRDIGTAIKQCATVPPPPAAPSPFEEVFKGFTRVAKKKLPRKPKRPKLTVVSTPPPDDDGPAAA
jgi:hypothetical protein